MVAQSSRLGRAPQGKLTGLRARSGNNRTSGWTACGKRVLVLATSKSPPMGRSRCLVRIPDLESAARLLGGDAGAAFVRPSVMLLLLVIEVATHMHDASCV